MVYKLVELEGKATMKNSENVDKTTLPGKKIIKLINIKSIIGQKNVFRVYVKSSLYPKLDIIACFDEKLEVG
jgi:hypothetical protein